MHKSYIQATEQFPKYWVVAFLQVSSMNERFRNIANLMGNWHCGQTHHRTLYYEGNVTCNDNPHLKYVSTGNWDLHV